MWKQKYRRNRSYNSRQQHSKPTKASDADATPLTVLPKERPKDFLPNQVKKMRLRAPGRLVAAHKNSSSVHVPYDADHPPPPPAKILPFLATTDNIHPLPIVPHNIMKTLESLKGKDVNAVVSVGGQAGVTTIKGGATVANPKASLRSMGVKDLPLSTAGGVLNKSEIVLSIPTSEIPPDPSTLPKPAQHWPAKDRPQDRGKCRPPEDFILQPKNLPSPATRANGPAYALGLTPAEARFALVEAPAKLEEMMDDSAETGKRFGERSELVRRVVCLENASQGEINKWNIARAVEMFGRRPFDTGSSEVQAAVFTVKIETLKTHLEKQWKDKESKVQLQKWIAKRRKILKYLRRKDLAKYVETCKALGVDPDSITA
ncbi:30S ribosomal protein S15 [Irineochytrium annulatum]|nr:30S ribosomal protein S15 [Irineochytrium annulatum]